MVFVVVDDENIALEDMKEKLSRVAPDCEIHTFRLAAKGLQYILENHQIDIVFLDIMMGGMTGIQMAEKIREVHPFLPIIFLTAYSDYALDAFAFHASAYLLKPVSEDALGKEIDHLQSMGQVKKKRVTVKTFGFFDVFVDGTPLLFSRSKSKEILAYLIDRRGAGVTMAQLASVLLENKDYDRSVQKQMQVFVSSMLQTLKEKDIDDIVVRNHNSIAIVPDKIDCDSYAAIAGDTDALLSFFGEYMSNYSWAEVEVADFAERQKKMK